MSLLHTSTAKRREMILNGRIVPTMLFLSLPMMMMAAVQSIIPTIDSLFINNFVGVSAAGAVSYSTPLIQMMVSIAQGLGVAAMAIIGQLNGRGEVRQVRYISTQIIAFAAMAGLLMEPLLLLASFIASHHVDPSMARDTFVYMALSSLVIPFQFLEVIYNAIKNSNGRPEAPFIRMVIMLGLKIVFNTLFVVVLHMGIVGSVMATLLANILICFWMYYEMFMRKSEDRLSFRGYKPDFGLLKELIHIGIPSMLSFAMLNIGFVLINNEVQKYGGIVMASQGISYSITSICYIVPSSIGGAVTTMVSMNIGAGQGHKARSSCVVGTLLSAVSAIMLTVVISLNSRTLVLLFTREPQVVNYANSFLHIYVYAIVGFGIFSAQVGALNGLGRTVAPLFLNVLRVWFFRYVFILVTESYLGVYAAFWGNLFSNILGATVTTIIFFTIKWVSALPQSGSVKDQQLPDTPDKPCES